MVTNGKIHLFVNSALYFTLMPFILSRESLKIREYLPKELEERQILSDVA